VRDRLTFQASVLFAIEALLVLPNPPAARAQPHESSEVWCKAYNSSSDAVRRCIEAEKRLLRDSAKPKQTGQPLPPPPGVTGPQYVYGRGGPVYYPDQGPGAAIPGQPGEVTGSTSGGEGRFAALPPDLRPESGTKELPPRFRRTLVEYRTKEPPGTLVVDTKNTYLYLVLDNGKAMRYGIGVGREGFTWAGTERASRTAEWPDWHPPEEMIERQPYLPRFMAGGPGNPLGARALYLGNTAYRIHGTNQPSTIGTFVSSGCIRLTNEDVTDLYSRVKVGTRVVVLPGKPAAAQLGSMRESSAPTAAQ
jgi:lipoprotein-anchoring transpeptidase ErfK/SrfK